MTEKDFDVVVIGGGPAGMAAALEALKSVKKVAIVERNDELGGILNQCIHSGFGLQYFNEELTGPEYAQRFIDRVGDSEIEVFLNTMVLEIKDKTVIAMNEEGILKLKAKAIVLAMGCRERTRGQIRIPGTRPAGVLTAGLAQRYTNLENLKPGNRVVILGSGDIGLIMARRLKLEGLNVLSVYEIMPYANGLFRNIKNCLDDFDIPLHLSTTVTKVIGSKRLQAVEVSAVDDNLEPIPGTEEIIPCDTLLLSVGLIPENEVSKTAGVDLSKITGGPVVSNDLQTSEEGIFACGNVLHVHDLVDHVTREAEEAGRNAARYALGETSESTTQIPVEASGPVRYVLPSTITNTDEKVELKFRVGSPIEKGKVTVYLNDEPVYEGREKEFVPSIMETVTLSPEKLSDGKLRVEVK